MAGGVAPAPAAAAAAAAPAGRAKPTAGEPAAGPPRPDPRLLDKGKWRCPKCGWVSNLTYTYCTNHQQACDYERTVATGNKDADSISSGSSVGSSQCGSPSRMSFIPGVIMSAVRRGAAGAAVGTGGAVMQDEEDREDGMATEVELDRYRREDCADDADDLKEVPADAADGDVGDERSVYGNMSVSGDAQSDAFSIYSSSLWGDNDPNRLQTDFGDDEADEALAQQSFQIRIDVRLPPALAKGGEGAVRKADKAMAPELLRRLRQQLGALSVFRSRTAAGRWRAVLRSPSAAAAAVHDLNDEHILGLPDDAHVEAQVDVDGWFAAKSVRVSGVPPGMTHAALQRLLEGGGSIGKVEWPGYPVRRVFVLPHPGALPGDDVAGGPPRKGDAEAQLGFVHFRSQLHANRAVRALSGVVLDGCMLRAELYGRLPPCPPAGDFSTKFTYTCPACGAALTDAEDFERQPYCPQTGKSHAWLGSGEGGWGSAAASPAASPPPDSPPAAAAV